MRLAAHSDFSYRRHDGSLWAEQSFVLFLCEVGRQLDGIVLMGRLDPADAEWHYRVPPDAGFAALPHYASLGDVRAALRAFPGALRRFWRVLEDVDLVWLLGPHPLSFPFALMARARGRKIALGVRQDLLSYMRPRVEGRPPLWWATLAMEHAFRALGRTCGVVVVGPDLLEPYGRSQRVLSTAISLVRADEVRPRQVQPSWDDEPIELLNVARLDPDKNSLLLADVLAELRSDGRDWRLTVCGEGPLKEPLRRRARDLGVEDALTLAGFVSLDSGLRDLYRTSHALLHVSYQEGFPQILIEAFANGLPVVATTVGGVLEGARGAARMVAPDDARGSAEAMRELAGSPELREQLVARGAAIARERTLEREASRVAAFLSES